MTWQFIDSTGAFTLSDPHKTSALYFPLVNESGMVSVVTPTLHGDAKTGQHSYLLAPVSVEDLHASRAARNFWIRTAGGAVWSAAGNSAPQTAATTDNVVLEAGILWHRITRTSPQLGLRAEITSLVPAGKETVELTQITLTNLGTAALTLTPTAAIPLYGRSADNLRDHRHVTSLLHRAAVNLHGVTVRPTLSFDERGHRPNELTYAVLGAEADGTAPVDFFPTVEDFIGEGGTLDWPAAIIDNVSGALPGTTVAGSEIMGGLKFRQITLAPGASQSYIVILAAWNREGNAEALLQHYGSAAGFAAALEATRTYWEEQLAALSVETGDARFNGWLRWVALQPILRRLCGNSFLPYHDYGRGGRGWRDLWQDLLALLLIEPADVRPLLLSNFAGIRADGSNATIIGSAPGEFKADRNNIPRVWMDHGAWPWLTTRRYLDTTGDLDFLLQEQAYFKDAHTHRAHATDLNWRPEAGTQLKTAAGSTCTGSILEHLLIQHLTAFFNVGEHNIILLEGADWNDGLDMARSRGESVAFSAMYADNLRQIADTLSALERQGTDKITLATELLPLLDTLNAKLDYNDGAAKQALLHSYFDAVSGVLSGEKAAVAVADLRADLLAKADWLTDHLRRQEWIAGDDGLGWFNGYYDEEGNRVEGISPAGVRMTLTGQVFALMGGIATDSQVDAVIAAVNRYLYEKSIGGPRLNTDFGAALPGASRPLSAGLGRCFGFAFGHKENGAMFTHMAVMYANALYRRGRIAEGYRVLQGIYTHCQDFAVSRIYPGLPEYVTPRGRGVYPYLTGSASWYILTLVSEAFGVRGDLGDLILAPQLVDEQYSADGTAALVTRFADRRLRIVFHRPADPARPIETITLDGRPVSFQPESHGARIPRALLLALAPDAEHTIEIR